MTDNKQNPCTHFVGLIGGEKTPAVIWNDRITQFAKDVNDFNTRGMRDQINHPGFVTLFNFCPNCGEKINRDGLLKLGEIIL